MQEDTCIPDMERIYNDYFPMVYNYVFYRLLHRHNTEDIVSHVFMKIFANLQKYDPAKSALKTWIMRITERTLIDYYRKQRPVISLDGDDSVIENSLSVHFDEQYEAFSSPNRQALVNAMKQLSERDHLFVYYKYYQGITNREIARRMGLNENTVSAALSRARQKLKVILENEI